MKRNVLLLILFVVLVAFWPCLYNDFVNWDDPDSLINNTDVRSFSFPDIFSHFVNGNYQPLTTLSYSFVYHGAGLNPGVHHAVNVFFHLINVLLVYFFIKFLIGQDTTALAIAFLFGIHPMHVESVAWVTERKDVLFCMFYLSSMIVYLKFIGQKKPKYAFFVTTLILFLLALLSKPTAMSLPFVLFLIDYYKGRKLTKANVGEKLPLIMFSLLFGLLAIYGNYFTPFIDNYPVVNEYHFTERLLFACYAVFFYVYKLLWPLGLSCFYPYPEKINGLFPMIYYFSPFFLLLIGWILWKILANRKLLVFACLFFIFTILFNLPILNVGHTITADRFTYLPCLGLFLIFAEIVESICFKVCYQNQKLKIVFGLALLLGILFLFFLTRQQCAVWKNDKTLWSNNIKNYPRVPMSYYKRGNYFAEHAQLDAAISDYSQAIVVTPDYAEVYNNRGNMYLLKGEYAHALEDYEAAIKTNKIFFDPYFNEAAYYSFIKDQKKALEIYNQILSMDPHHERALREKQLMIEKINKDNKILR